MRRGRGEGRKGGEGDLVSQRDDTVDLEGRMVWRAKYNDSKAKDPTHVRLSTTC